MFKEELKKYIDSQIYISTELDSYSGILLHVTDNSIVVRTVFPGYGDITDYVLRINQISYVRLIV